MFTRNSSQAICYFTALLIVAISVAGCDKAKEFADNLENKVTGKTDEKPAQAPPQDTTNTSQASSSSSSSDSSDTTPMPVVPVKTEKTSEEVIAEFLKAKSEQIGDERLQLLGSLESGLDTITAVSLYRSKVTEKGLAELKKLPNMVVLDMSGTTIGDSAMDIVCEFTQLRQLNVDLAGLTDSGLAKLASLKQLEALDISRNDSITGAGMASFRDIPLRAFYANFTKFGQSGLQHLKSTQNLEILALRNTQITDQTIGAIGQFKGLRRLDISQNGDVTDKGLSSLRGLSKLEYLAVMSCKISNDGLGALRTCRALTDVNATGNFVDHNGVKMLQEANREREVRVAYRGLADAMEAEKLLFASTDPNIANFGVADGSSTTESSAPPIPVVRTWTNSEGTKTLQGEFVKFEGGKVYLKLDNGNEVELTMSQLSKEDQEWVREELKRRSG